jgi:hypothetical protein
MTLGGATVSSVSASSLAPTAINSIVRTPYSPTMTATNTTAKIYLGSDDTFTVNNSGATLYGSSGNDAVTIVAGMSNVILDQNVERINLSGTAGSYTFKQTGNKINVYDTTGAMLIVAAPVQGDTDGTLLGFSDGTASVLLSGGVMTLGGKIVSAGTPSALAPTLTP